MLAGGAAWLYRVVLFNRLGPRYPYRLETVVPAGEQHHRSCDAPGRPAHDVRARDLCLLAGSRYGGQQKELASFFDLLVAGGSGSARVDPDSRRFHAPVTLAQTRDASGRLRPLRRVHFPSLRSFPPDRLHRRGHWHHAVPRHARF